MAVQGVPSSSADAPKAAVVESWVEEDLFDRLTAIHVQLVESTDRWFLSGCERPWQAHIARAALRRERDAIEEELRRRYFRDSPHEGGHSGPPPPCV